MCGGGGGLDGVQGYVWVRDGETGGERGGIEG